MRGVVVKPGSLNVSRKHVWAVLMRNQRSGPTHGQWEPITNNTFLVLCASKKDAMELRLRIGSRYFPQLGGYLDDDAYEARLERFIKISPWDMPSERWCWDYDLYRGWVPSADEIVSGKRDSADDWEHHNDLLRTALGVSKFSR